MLVFYLIVAVALGNRFYVCAHQSLIIGKDNIIPANTTAYTSVWHTNPPKPSIHPGYKVSNIGSSAVHASIYWKDSFPLQSNDVFCETDSNCPTNISANIWYQLPDTLHILPHKTVIIRPPPNMFYFSRLVIIADQNEDNDKLEALAHVEYVVDGADSIVHRKRNKDVPGTHSNLTLSENLKTVLKFAGSKIPPGISGSGIEAFIELFWPKNETNIWDEILDQVRYLIDRETFVHVNAIIDVALMGLKNRLTELVLEIEEGQSGVSAHYMNIAQDLMSLDDLLVIRNHRNAKKLNFDLLPLYSTVISMKALYYSLGLECDQRLKLTVENVASVKQYFDNTINLPKTGAKDRILELFMDQQDLPADRRYDRVMSAQNALNQHGYVPMWNNLKDHPRQTFVDSEIIYSRLIGKDSDEIVEFARQQPKEPLTPSLLDDGAFNMMEKLEYFSKECRDGDILCIAAMKVILKNWHSYESGYHKDTPFFSSVQFQDNQHPITSIGLHQPLTYPSVFNSTADDRFSNYYYISVGMHVRTSILLPPFWYYPYAATYKLGLVEADKSMKNASIEVPTGYKVAALNFNFDEYSILRNLAASFLPDPDRSLVVDNAGADWKEWKC